MFSHMQSLKPQMARGGPRGNSTLLMDSDDCVAVSRRVSVFLTCCLLSVTALLLLQNQTLLLLHLVLHLPVLQKVGPGLAAGELEGHLFIT